MQVTAWSSDIQARKQKNRPHNKINKWESSFERLHPHVISPKIIKTVICDPHYEHREDPSYFNLGFLNSYTDFSPKF